MIRQMQQLDQPYVGRMLNSLHVLSEHPDYMQTLRYEADDILFTRRQRVIFLVQELLWEFMDISLYIYHTIPPRWISIVKAYLINFWYDNKTGSLFGSLYGIFLKRLLYAQFQINDVWIRGCLVLLYPDADIQHFKARCRDSLSDVRDALGEQREDPFPCSIDVSLLLNNTFHDFLPFYCWYGTPSTT